MEAAAAGLVTVLGHSFSSLGRHLIGSHSQSQSQAAEQLSLPESIACLERDHREVTSIIRDAQGALSRPGLLSDLRGLDPRISFCIRRYHSLEDGRQHGVRMIHRVKTAWQRRKLAKFVKKTDSLLRQAIERAERFSRVEVRAQPQPVAPPTPTATACHAASDARLEGFEAPAADLVDLLAAGGEDPMMVAVTGPPGSGKTAIVGVVYDAVREQFQRCVWVKARGLGVEEILRGLLAQTGAQVQVDAGAELLAQQLKQHLEDTRYLVVFDDMHKNNWSTIQQALPANKKKNRVVMIVCNQGIIRSHWRSSFRLYKVEPLERHHARNLLIRTAFADGAVPYSGKGLEKILDESGCLPQAIISMGEYLRSRSSLNEKQCESICSNLGFILYDHDAFSKMFDMLDRTYKSLPDLARECCMYLSEGSKDQVLEKDAFIRKWVHSEGVTKCVTDSRPFEEIAEEQFKELVDHNIIEPVETGINGEVYRVQGMMFEYIRHKAVCDNHATFICKDHTGDHRLPKQIPGVIIRRLVYQSSVSDEPDGAVMHDDLSQLQSATISGPAGNVLRALNKSETLQELNLNNCNDNDRLNISRFPGLIYLRVNQCSPRLLRKLKKLHKLATLDMKGTNVDLPIQVTQLPNLVFLVGHFCVSCKSNDKKKMRKLHKLFKKSKLQRIEGLYVDGSAVFLECLPDMLKLKVLKLCCRQNAEDGDFSSEIMASSISGCQGLTFLSIDFGNVHPLDFLMGIEPASFRCLASLELRGQLSKLPAFIPHLDELLHLALTDTGLGLHSLAEVAEMPHLSRLQLVEKNPDLFREEQFVIRGLHFPRLQHLSIVAPRIPKIVIEEGALPGLQAIELIGTELGGISGMQHLTRLEKIVIDANASEEALRILSHEASMHPMKPRIVKKSVTLPATYANSAASCGSTTSVPPLLSKCF